MSNEVEPIFVIRQEIIVLPKAKPTITQGVHVTIKMRYMNPNLISKMEAHLEEVQRIGVNGFIM
jgi:hypothetical protein